MKAACDELGITLIAYSPIAQGRTTFILKIFFIVLLVYENHAKKFPIFQLTALRTG